MFVCSMLVVFICIYDFGRYILFKRYLSYVGFFMFIKNIVGVLLYSKEFDVFIIVMKRGVYIYRFVVDENEILIRLFEDVLLSNVVFVL